MVDILGSMDYSIMILASSNSHVFEENQIRPYSLNENQIG